MKKSKTIHFVFCFLLCLGMNVVFAETDQEAIALEESEKTVIPEDELTISDADNEYASVFNIMMFSSKILPNRCGTANGKLPQEFYDIQEVTTRWIEEENNRLSNLEEEEASITERLEKSDDSSAQENAVLAQNQYFSAVLDTLTGSNLNKEDQNTATTAGDFDQGQVGSAQEMLDAYIAFFESNMINTMNRYIEISDNIKKIAQQELSRIEEECKLKKKQKEKKLCEKKIGAYTWILGALDWHKKINLRVIPSRKMKNRLDQNEQRLLKAANSIVEDEELKAKIIEKINRLTDFRSKNFLVCRTFPDIIALRKSEEPLTEKKKKELGSSVWMQNLFKKNPKMKELMGDSSEEYINNYYKAFNNTDKYLGGPFYRAEIFKKSTVSLENNIKNLQDLSKTYEDYRSKTSQVLGQFKNVQSQSGAFNASAGLTLIKNKNGSDSSEGVSGSGNLKAGSISSGSSSSNSAIKMVARKRTQPVVTSDDMKKGIGEAINVSRQRSEAQDKKLARIENDIKRLHQKLGVSGERSNNVTNFFNEPLKSVASLANQAKIQQAALNDNRDRQQPSTSRDYNSTAVTTDRQQMPTLPSGPTGSRANVGGKDGVEEGIDLEAYDGKGFSKKMRGNSRYAAEENASQNTDGISQDMEGDIFRGITKKYRQVILDGRIDSVFNRKKL